MPPAPSLAIQGSSAVGLTAYITQDPETKDLVLERSFATARLPNPACLPSLPFSLARLPGGLHLMSTAFLRAKQRGPCAERPRHLLY